MRNIPFQPSGSNVASKAILQKKAIRIITFSSFTCTICKYLGLPSPTPMFVLLSMRSDCYVD